MAVAVSRTSMQPRGCSCFKDKEAAMWLWVFKDKVTNDEPALSGFEPLVMSSNKGRQQQRHYLAGSHTIQCYNLWRE